MPVDLLPYQLFLLQIDRDSLIAFDVGRTLPNTGLNRDFMELVDGSVDLGGADDITKSLGSSLAWARLPFFLSIPALGKYA